MNPAPGTPPYYTPAGLPYRPRRRRGGWVILGFAAALIVFAAVLLLIALFPAAFGLAPTHYPYRFGLFGGVFALFFLLVIVFFVVRVVFWSRRAARYRAGGGGGYGMDRAAMIARMRYARGEISKEQYDQIMRDLGRGPGSP